MNLENLVSASGIGGIHKVIATRSNGLIIEDLNNGKTRFLSSRKYKFTPLESISVFTDDGESTELSKVFESMLGNIDEHVPPTGKVDGQSLKDYFKIVLPNFDPDRVHNSDIKKIISWFNFLKERDLLSLSEEKAQSEEE